MWNEESVCYEWFDDCLSTHSPRQSFVVRAGRAMSSVNVGSVYFTTFLPFTTYTPLGSSEETCPLLATFTPLRVYTPFFSVL